MDECGLDHYGEFYRAGEVDELVKAKDDYIAEILQKAFCLVCDVKAKDERIAELEKLLRDIDCVIIFEHASPKHGNHLQERLESLIDLTQPPALTTKEQGEG